MIFFELCIRIKSGDAVDFALIRYNSLVTAQRARAPQISSRKSFKQVVVLWVGDFRRTPVWRARDNHNSIFTLALYSLLVACSAGWGADGV